MITRRQVLIGTMVVSAVLMCWAGTVLAGGGRGQALPATGQTTCADSTGTIVPCFGSEQDGDIQAGATLSYTDNGDGTITDNNTNLMWEKKSDDGSINDKDATYTWDDAFAVHVAGLNQMNFAGHNDWRLPNVKELQSIVDYENINPCVAAPFNAGCSAGCTVLNCSCTSGAAFNDHYWSSTSDVGFPSGAWFVFFFSGGTIVDLKSTTNHVRAVRGGSNLGPSK